MPVENIVNTEECFKNYNLFLKQKKPHADNLSRISSREKYSACNPNKTPCVIYDNHQGVTHILEAPVCIAISLSQHSVKYKL